MNRNLKALTAVILLFSFSHTPTTPSLAASATYYVSPVGVSSGACPVSTPCQLEYAISLANATSDLDTIYLKSGTYTKATDTPQEFLLITNSLHLVGRCNDNFTTCSQENPETILDGQGKRRIMKLDMVDVSDGAVTLENIKFQWGNGNSQVDFECQLGEEGCGGAIFVKVGQPDISLFIDQCYFYGNTARQPEINNPAEMGSGGAIYFNNVGNLEISNSTFYGNKAIATGSGYGGAIFVQGSYASIEQTTFHQNNCNWDSSTGVGCGIYSFQNFVTYLKNNTFTGNSINASDVSQKSGSAVSSYLDQSILAFGNLFHSNFGDSTFYLSPASDGHGIQIGLNRFWGNHTTSMVQVFSISGSKQQIYFLSNFMGTDDRYDIDGKFYGGILFQNFNTSNYLSINFWNNSLGYLDQGFSFSGLLNVDMTNNILAHAQDATFASDWLKISLTGQNNLVYDIDDLNNFPTINRLQMDPLFVNGAQGDFHLIDCSPAIEAGVSGLAAPIFTDIDGDPRAVGLPDIGADEYAIGIYLPVIVR